MNNFPSVTTSVASETFCPSTFQIGLAYSLVVSSGLTALIVQWWNMFFLAFLSISLSNMKEIIKSSSMRNAGLFLSFHDEVDEMMCVSRSVMNSQTSPMKEHFTSICTSLRYLSIYTSLNSVSNRDDVSERILVLSSEDRFVRYAHQAWGQRFLNSQLSPTLISYGTDAEAMNLSGGSSLFSHFRKTEAFPTDSFNTLGQSPQGFYLL